MRHGEQEGPPSLTSVLFVQMEQVRNELLQERAMRQDLECDKISLERQVRVTSPLELLPARYLGTPRLGGDVLKTFPGCFFQQF